MTQDIPITHCLTLENRETLTISGVTDVDTFDENKITLFTDREVLVIEGEELHIRKLDLEHGELSIEGDIVSLVYTDADRTGNKGFFRKMLR